MTPQQFDKIVAEAREIAFGAQGDGGKHADYNAGNADLYKITGLVGRAADIWRKAIRFAVAIGTGRLHVLEEDALDLINYCIMFLVVLRENRMTKITKEFSNDYQDPRS